MKPNLIILTGGLSGSSVLAGLISGGEYWLGDSTKEIRYETFENSQLVDLNTEILNSSGYTWKDAMDIPSPSVENIKQVALGKETDKFRDFVKKCDNNAPWLWKDPRLCYTISFWKHFINVENCKFILMSRDISQAWTGIVLRGKMPIAYNDLETVEQNCINHSKNFFMHEKIDYLNITFEDLILTPEDSLNNINKFLGMQLDLNDLKEIYKGPLYQTRWSMVDYYKARVKFIYYKYIKRDVIEFPRKKTGKGSGWHHLKK